MRFNAACSHCSKTQGQFPLPHLILICLIMCICWGNAACADTCMPYFNCLREKRQHVLPAFWRVTFCIRRGYDIKVLDVHCFTGLFWAQHLIQYSVALSFKDLETCKYIPRWHAMVYFDNIWKTKDPHKANFKHFCNAIVFFKPVLCKAADLKHHEISGQFALLNAHLSLFAEVLPLTLPPCEVPSAKLKMRYCLPAHNQNQLPLRHRIRPLRLWLRVAVQLDRPCAAIRGRTLHNLMENVLLYLGYLFLRQKIASLTLFHSWTSTFRLQIAVFRRRFTSIAHMLARVQVFGEGGPCWPWG